MQCSKPLRRRPRGEVTHRCRITKLAAGVSGQTDPVFRHKIHAQRLAAVKFMKQRQVRAVWRRQQGHPEMPMPWWAVHDDNWPPMDDMEHWNHDGLADLVEKIMERRA